MLHGDDALIFAAAAGNFALVRERIEGGADVNHVEPSKGSSLYAGVRSPGCLALLLSRGADPNGYTAPNGDTALDHALLMSNYYTAQSAWLLYQAGAKSCRFTVLPRPSAERIMPCRLSIRSGDWFRHYCLGQVCFGTIRPGDGGWHASCNDLPGSGCFFRIEALYLSDRLNLQAVSVGEEGFELVDFRGESHAWGGEPHEITLSGAISMLD